MAITQLDIESDVRDIYTAAVTALTHTPSASKHTQCQVCIELGDGADDLCGTGGPHLIYITVGGQELYPLAAPVFATATRASWRSDPFPVPANQQVVVKVKSPNAADTAVATTARLYEVATYEVDVIKWLATAVTVSAGTGLPEVDAKSISDSAQAANRLESAAQVNGVNLNTSQSVPTTPVTGSVGYVLKRLKLLGVGADNNILLSTDAQDLSGSLDVRVKATVAGSLESGLNFVMSETDVTKLLGQLRMMHAHTGGTVVVQDPASPNVNTYRNEADDGALSVRTRSTTGGNVRKVTRSAPS